MHQSICDGTTNNPCLVQESNSPYTSVESLRDTTMISAYYQYNTAGVDNLWASASAEPDEYGWLEVADYIKRQSNNTVKNIIVLDLRQESHGYINGRAITLTNKHNWINLNKGKQQVLIDENNWLNELKTKKEVYGVLTPQQFELQDFSNGYTLEIETVSNEEQLVKQAGLQYQRIIVTDHRAPLDEEIDNFIKFYNELPKKTWLHIHCRGGKGRSTTFLAMIDMLNNANIVSFHEIIARQASIPPFYNLAEFKRTEPDLSPFYEARFNFLINFYQYAQQSLSGFQGNWSEWKRANFKLYLAQYIFDNQVII